MSDVSWQIKSLSELGRFSRGKSKHRPRNDKKLFTNGTYPLIQTGDIKNANLYVTKNSDYYNEFGLSQSKLWEQGTLCITIAANIAETAILSYPMCFPDSVVGFNAYKNESSELFVYYVFELLKKEIQKTSSGSIQDNINIDYLTKLKFKVPNKDYQDRIVNLLSTIDKKILINNQINEELEAMAKTLYDYWFVQFDFPDENGKPYKSSGGKMVYNDQLKREIPEGWGVKQLGELSTYVTDKISSNDLNSKNYIGTDNMLSNMKGIEQATYLPNSTLVNSFISNDILIANIRPYFKKIWISDRAGGCSSDVLCLRANDKEICNYLFYSLARDDFFNYNVAGSKGSKMPRGDKAHIQKYSVLYSEKHAFKFSKLVSNFISQKHLIYKQNQELSQLRDWLLPMLINGQAKVEE
ncbi:TPA: restriction endonuclease subunit S [Streptococcus suis]